MKHVVWERMLADEPDVSFGSEGELGSANTAGGTAGPAITNMRICTGKGSVVVVDALNGDNAVPRVMGSPQGGHRVLKNR
jgi:hypothetical protein